MAAVQLGTKATGSIVNININNALREFIVVQHGRPSEIYSNGWNGVTILLMRTVYESRQWHSSNVSDYEKSTIHSYLNNAFLKLMDVDIRDALVEVKLPYRAGPGESPIVTSGESGLPARAFLLSAYEVGNPVDASLYDGDCFTYFEVGVGSSANTKRIGYLGGSSVRCWCHRQ